MRASEVKLSRRKLIAGSATGLTLSFTLPTGHAVQAKGTAASFSAYLQIDADNTVRIFVPGIEMGQGVFTSLPKILAEELEADFDTVEIALAPGDEIYANPAKGRQSTGVSDAVMGYTPTLRRTGAAAKEMLIAAAAKQWGVSAGQCHAAKSRITHTASGRTCTFGDVALAAAKLPVPKEPKLKAREDFTLIGKPCLRKDTPAKVDGSARFGADIVLPNLAYATVRHCPVFGGVVKDFDATAAAKFPGVIAAVPLKDARRDVTAIGIVAETYWQAKKAAEALFITWDTKGNERLNSRDMSRAMIEALDDDASAKVMAFSNGRAGDAKAALKSAAKTLSVVYELPYLAHACMEPIAATCIVRNETAELWIPSQQQGRTRQLAADLTGLALEKVTVNTTFAGGGFGRKWEMDMPQQVVQLAAAVKGRPVRMIWSREEDIQHDYYRPPMVARVQAGVDAQGALTVMTARMAGQSMLAFQRRSPKPPMPDGSVVSGALNPRYAVPNSLIDFVEMPFPVNVGFWRAVGMSHNGFIAECAVDEAAHLAGDDPLAFRRTLLKGKARELKVLDTIAEMSGWGRKLPPGQGLGIAISSIFDSVIAQVALVTVESGRLKINKVWCVYDAGLVIDPTNVVAQMEGGIVFGLSAALFGEITIDKGAVQQSNFIDYEMVRMATMPEIEVKLTETGEKPGGAGEASVPGIAPAVANAVFAATGQRIRKLPLRTAGLTVA